MRTVVEYASRTMTGFAAVSSVACSYLLLRHLPKSEKTEAMSSLTENVVVTANNGIETAAIGSPRSHQ